jgi:hypothetical protein
MKVIFTALYCAQVIHYVLFICFLFFVCVLVGLEFELRASGLQGK